MSIEGSRGSALTALEELVLDVRMRDVWYVIDHNCYADAWVALEDLAVLVRIAFIAGWDEAHRDGRKLSKVLKEAERGRMSASRRVTHHERPENGGRRMTNPLLAGLIGSALLLIGAAGGYWQGWQHALAAAGRARARHNAEENRRRTEQEQEIAGMNRDQRRKAAQVAAREVSKQGGRTKRGRS